MLPGTHASAARPAPISSKAGQYAAWVAGSTAQLLLLLLLLLPTAPWHEWLPRRLQAANPRKPRNPASPHPIYAPMHPVAHCSDFHITYCVAQSCIVHGKLRVEFVFVIGMPQTNTYNRHLTSPIYPTTVLHGNATMQQHDSNHSSLRRSVHITQTGGNFAHITAFTLMQ